MNIVKQKVEMVDMGNSMGIDVLKKIEKAGRTCYKSEDSITDESCKKFVRNIIKRDHGSVLEHHNITLKFITDRGVTHEIVRHRVGCSYSQESTRYVNYNNQDMTFILPVEFYGDDSKRTESFYLWQNAMSNSEFCYKSMINNECTPQLARSVLPNSLKTEIVMTANIRAWRHFFKLRCDKSAHPQMQDLAKKALFLLWSNIPVIFDDLFDKYITERNL